ncbi:MULTISPECIES: hypothetical protein [Aequorivita]|uniref:Multidrug transporter n=2 Tax=Aequorivita TaxID=153265 RepID=A0AB35YML8_9FLAO|nr:hypothetical protein [Aequorivita sp. Ant34-E75]WGF92020.1 hypothetical protein QCQ61_12490 [Aequorivita sp. Ant34-E75]
MGDTTNGFGKKRDYNQYGEVEKDPEDTKKERDLPKPANKGVKKKK